MILNRPIGEYDIVLQSKDRKSNIIFNFVDIESNYLPSINYIVNINDQKFAGEVNVWIDKEVFSEFFEGLIKANIKRTGNFIIRSMTPEELELDFISQSSGRYEILYSIKKSGFIENRLNETVLKGSFEYDTEFLNQLAEKLKDVKKLFM